MTALQITVGWPAKALWPNGGNPHHMVLHRHKKAAKIEAMWAAKMALRFDWHPAAEKIKVHLVAHPHLTGPHPDADNLIASMKSHFDGIAGAIGVNDRDFEAPTVEFADRKSKPIVIVEIG